jgi:hypothetical protein
MNDVTGIVGVLLLSRPGRMHKRNATLMRDLDCDVTDGRAFLRIIFILLWRRPRPKLGCGAKERKKEEE